MIGALWHFTRSQVAPRRRSIIVSSEVVLALLAAIAFGVVGDHIGAAEAQAGDIVVALLAYSAIGLGFGVAGLTLALTAPDRGFAQELAWSDPAQDGLAKTAPAKNSYANLLFIFSWTAFAHWVVVVGSFALLAALGKEGLLLTRDSSPEHRAAVALLCFATLYAVELFLITIVTLAQVGETYVRRLHNTRPTDADRSGPRSGSGG